MDWKHPAPDPECPECPYGPGFVIKAKEHEPPTPFGRGRHDDSIRNDPPRDSIATLPQTRHVLDYPPLDTKWPDGKARAKATITLKAKIPNGRDRGAKLFVCNVHVMGSEEPYTAVAKIFDALYYIPEDWIEAYVVSEADEDYSKEAWAYRTLQTTTRPQKPGFMPAYFGSWTFDLPLTLGGKKHTRSVRFVLIEYIRGTTMRDLLTLKNHDSTRSAGCRCLDVEHYPDAFQFDEAYRLGILAQILEGRVKQRHAGVGQGDCAPRNIILAAGPRGVLGSLSTTRVVLIDYNNALFDKFCRWRHDGPLQWSDEPLPRNPAEYFWNNRMSDFRGWVPAEWTDHYNEGLESVRNWLMSTFVQNGVDEKFMPIEKSDILKRIPKLRAPKSK